MYSKVSTDLQELSVRQMSFEDLTMVLGWCKDEGWNVGQYDNQIYHRVAPTAHMLFLLNEEPIGAISLVKHSETFFTLGPFIVKKEFRQRGYGSQIWQYAMQCAELPNTIALYAVPTQIDRYRKSGFESRFPIKRWEFFNKTSLASTSHSACQQITEAYIPEISSYDQRIFGTSRRKWLENLINIPAISGCFIKNNDEITGFGVIRPCVKGFRIGPLFANTAEDAKELFFKLIESIGDNDIIIDIPATNPYAEIFANYFNLQAVSENDTQAMLRGEPPQEFLDNIDKNYGIFSLEVG